MDAALVYVTFELFEPYQCTDYAQTTSLVLQRVRRMHYDSCAGARAHAHVPVINYN